MLEACYNVTVEEFKCSLDKFLEILPDEPKVENYVPSACNILTARPSNSIIDLVKSWSMVNKTKMLGGHEFSS